MVSVSRDNLVSTYLICGGNTIILDYAENFLQKALCQKVQQGAQSCFCAVCRKIKSRQHHAFVWISPESDYKIDDIDIIFEKTRFALDPGTQFFFILEKAETLSSLVANKLLKVLEEPPAGYIFLLLTSNQQAILKTILSRCCVIRLAGETQATHEHPILEYFMYSYKINDAVGFVTTLRNNKLTDTQTMQLADALYTYFAERSRGFFASGEHDTAHGVYAQKALETLTVHMRKPAQSGSSELFWKNLFLHFPRP